MKKSIFTSAIVMIAIAISGCSSTTKSSSPTSSPSTSTSNGVVGFGATSDAWNAHHIADSSGNFVPGSGYNPDPNLASWVSTVRYSALIWSGGIVIGYNLNLVEGTKLKAAMAEALAEMPKDAKISFFYDQDKCPILGVTSAILKPILSGPDIGSSDGSVNFLFATVAKDGTLSYNKGNIDTIYVDLGLGLAQAKEFNC